MKKKYINPLFEIYTIESIDTLTDSNEGNGNQELDNNSDEDEAEI